MTFSVKAFWAENNRLSEPTVRSKCHFSVSFNINKDKKLIKRSDL